MRLVSVLICLRLGMSATRPPTACPYLGSGDEEEAAGEKKSLHRGLHIAELDSIQVENTLTVGQDQCVQCENLEHLEGRHQRTPALLNDVTHCSTHTHNTHTCETMHIQCISNVRLKQYNSSLFCCNTNAMSSINRQVINYFSAAVNWVSNVRLKQYNISSEQ